MKSIFNMFRIKKLVAMHKALQKMSAELYDIEVAETISGEHPKALNAITDARTKVYNATANLATAIENM